VSGVDFALAELLNAGNIAETSCDGTAKDMLKEAALNYARSRNPPKWPDTDWRTYAELQSCWREEEFQWLVAHLRFTQGNVSAAAKRAEIDRRLMYRLMQRYDIDPEIYR